MHAGKSSQIHCNAHEQYTNYYLHIAKKEKEKTTVTLLTEKLNIEKMPQVI